MFNRNAFEWSFKDLRLKAAALVHLPALLPLARKQAKF